MDQCRQDSNHIIRTNSQRQARSRFVSLARSLSKSEAGFGLLEIVIASSLMTVILLAVAQMFVSQSQQVTYQEDRLSRIALRTELERMLRQNTQACTKSLQGFKLKDKGKSTAVLIKDDQGRVVFNPSVGSKNDFEQLDIKKIEVEDLSVYSSPIKEGQLRLSVDLKRKRKGIGPQELKPIEMDLTVAMDPKTKEITDCLGGGAEALGCVYQDMAEHSPGSGYGSFKLPSDTKVITLKTSNGTPVVYDRCDDDITCYNESVQYTIYPGVTKIGGRSFPEGATLKKVKVSDGMKKAETCSGNSKASVETYHVDYYYGGHKLATQWVRQKGGADGVVCTEWESHIPQLNTNTMPVSCPITSGRSAASVPYNYNFSLYKAQD